MWANLIESHLKEREKERLLSMQAEEMKTLKERLDELEHKIA